MSLHNVQQNDATEDGNFTRKRMFQFLQLYSKKFAWAAKTLICQINF